MAGAVGKELSILISGNNAAGPGLKQLRSDLEGVGGQATQTGAAASKASGGFNDMLAAGAKMGVGFIGVTSVMAAVQKLGSSITDAIGNASNLNETMSKADVVFGASSAAVKAFGDTAAASIGQSKEQAIAGAAMFGNLFKTMGMGVQDSANMSVATVKLASDLASFHNIDPAQALEKLRAGLIGEAEPMRSLGVMLDEETVKLKAFEMGLAKGSEELSQSAKVHARYAIILGQTKDAQGDFARTSDGLANSQRTVAANMADLSATIGSELLPVVAAATNALAKGLPEAIEQTKKLFNDLRPVVSGVGDALGFIGEAVGYLPGKFGELGHALDESQVSMAEIEAAARDEIHGPS